MRSRPTNRGSRPPSGRAEEVTDGERLDEYLRGRAAGGEEGKGGEDEGSDGPGRFHLFRAEIAEVALVGLNEARDRLVIEHWAEGRGLRRIERE